MSFNSIDNLNGHVVVITGAMGGMGKAIAKRLAARGASIVGIVRRDIDAAQNELNMLGENNLAINASIDDTSALMSAFNTVKEKYGRCDILVNTAGFSKGVNHQDLDKLTDDRTFTPLLMESENGLIVNISSAAGIRSGGSNIAYAAAKAGTDSMTRNLAKALAPKVRVISIAPSAVDTNFLPNRSPEFLAKQAKATPLGRIGEVDDIAGAVEACATTMRFMTGNCLVIDGGRTI